MQFLNNIRSSIYDLAYYKEILNKPFSYSLRYFLSLMALVSLMAAISFSFFVLPEMNKVINKIDPIALSIYPDNLEIAAKNGIISTNVAEPFFIKLPDELKSDIKDLKNDESVKTGLDLAKIENLMVIDTGSSLSADLLRDYKTFAVLGKDSVAYYDDEAITIAPLGKDANGVVTKAKFSAALNEIMPYIKILSYAMVPFAFLIVFLGSVFGYLIYLIFGAAVIWLAAKAAKREMGYDAAYQVGLHAITLGVILEFTLFWVYPNLQVPFFFTFLMVVAVWVNLNFASGADKVPLPPPEAPTTGGKA